MMRAMTKASVALLVAVGLTSGAAVQPAQAAAVSVNIPKSASVPLDGDCFQLPVQIQPPADVDHWSLDIDVDNAGSGFEYGNDGRAAKGDLQHCPYVHGVGKFSWTAVMEWSDYDSGTDGQKSFAGTFTIHKATRTGKLKVSDTTPKFGQRVKFRTCIPGPRYVNYKLQVKSAGKTASKSYTTSSTGCDTRKLTWPKNKKAVKYRLSIPGDDVNKSFTSKWITVRGHA
jgi:hypothetical protein